MGKDKKSKQPRITFVKTELIENIERLLDMHPSRYTPEDLFELICQQVNPGSVVPLAIEILLINPLEEAGYYPGALLGAILRVAPGYWRNRKDQKAEIDQIIAALPPNYGEIAFIVKDDIQHWISPKPKS